MALAGHQHDVLLAAAQRITSGERSFNILGLVCASLAHTHYLRIDSLLALARATPPEEHRDAMFWRLCYAIELWLQHQPKIARALYEAIPSDPGDTALLHCCTAALLGHSKLESTVRYLGIEVDDALDISEQSEF